MLEIGSCRLRTIRRSVRAPVKMTQKRLCQQLKLYGIVVTPQYISNLERNIGVPANHLMLKALSIIFDRDMGDFYDYRW